MMQNHVSGVTYAQPIINVQLPNFSVQNAKLVCTWNCVSEFTTQRKISESWIYHTAGKKPLKEI